MTWFIPVLVYIAIVAILASNVFGLAWALFLQLSILAGILLVGAVVLHAVYYEKPEE